MTTHTHNHLLLTTNLRCTSGPWQGERASWGLRFCVGGGGGPTNEQRPGLTEGQIELNTFDCHTDVYSRSLTIASQAGTVLGSWVGDDSPTEENVTQNDIDFFLTKAVNFWVDVSAFVPSVWVLDYIKLYAVDAAGKSPLGPNTWTPSTPWAAAGTGNYLSPEVCFCMSLYSAHRARSGRGRIYIGPLITSTISATGTMGTAFANTVPAAVKTLLDSVRTRGTPGTSAVYTGIIWNRHGPGAGPPHGTQGVVINKVRSGDEMDVQERRTNLRPETYAEFSIV